MRRLAGSSAGVAMLCVCALAFGQDAPRTPDRSATVVKAQEALRADGSRPGDELLDCEQIGVELAGLFGQMGPQLDTLFGAAERANAEANRTQQMLAVRQATEGPARMARSVAEGLLAGTNPVAAAALARAGAVRDQIPWRGPPRKDKAAMPPISPPRMLPPA